jgi:hypothetical protein
MIKSNRKYILFYYLSILYKTLKVVMSFLEIITLYSIICSNPIYLIHSNQCKVIISSKTGTINKFSFAFISSNIFIQGTWEIMISLLYHKENVQTEILQ